MRGEILREVPGRKVYRAVVGGIPAIVKEFMPKGPRRWLRAYARDEATRALAARERGVAMVEPLAWAQLADGRQMLVLREESGALSLHDVVLDPPRGRARHALAQRVGRLIAKLQNEGFRHKDLHAGNILVRPDGSVLLSDAWGLRAGSYLTPKKRAKDLALFAPFFLSHASTVDLLAFWGAYGRASGLSPRGLEELRRSVRDRLPRAFRLLTRSRVRRNRRHGRPVECAGLSGVVLHGDLSDEMLSRIVNCAQDPQPGDVIKRGRTALTMEVDDFFVKVFLPRKATRPVRELVLGTRADRALAAAGAFEHRGLWTPSVVAILRNGDRAILVTQKATGALPIEDVGRALAPAAARNAAVRLGRTLRRMHDWGLRHRDLKQQNLMLSPDGSRVCFLDLDGVRQGGSLDWAHRLKDLANLDSSLFDRTIVPTGLRLRCLDAYLGSEQPPGFRPGEFVRRLIETAARHRERRMEQ